MHAQARAPAHSGFKVQHFLFDFLRPRRAPCDDVYSSNEKWMAAPLQVHRPERESCHKQSATKSGLKSCRACSSELDATAQICQVCGEQQHCAAYKRCTHCSSELDSTAKVCAVCGEKQAVLLHRLEGSSSSSSQSSHSQRSGPMCGNDTPAHDSRCNSNEASRPELLWIGHRAIKVRDPQGHVRRVVLPMPVPSEESCVEWMTKQ